MSSGDEMPDATTDASLSDSGELVLAEELPSGAPRRPSITPRSGWRLRDDEDSSGGSDEAPGLADEARPSPSDAARAEPDEDQDDGPELGQLLDASPQAATDGPVDLAGSGEGPLLLDASPDAGPLPPLPPPPPPSPERPSGRLTPTQPLLRQGPASAAGAPAKISRRLGEFYPGEDPPPPRPSTRRIVGPLCHVCGVKLEGPRCGRCGEPARVAGSDATHPVVNPRARSTPRAGSLSAAVRDRLARESEQRAALSAAAEATRRARLRTRLLGGLVLCAGLGLPVSLLVAPLWLVGLLALLDAGLGLAAGWRLARAGAAAQGAIAAGWAVGGSVGLKLLIGASTSDVSLLGVIGAGAAAVMIAAVVGALLSTGEEPPAA